MCALKISGWEKNNWKMQWPKLSVSQQHVLSGQIPGDGAASIPSDFILFHAPRSDVPWQTLIQLLFVGEKVYIFFYILPRIEMYYGQKHNLWSQKAYCQTQDPHLVVVLGWLGEVAQLMPCAQAPRWVGEREPKSRLTCIYLTAIQLWGGPVWIRGCFLLM